MKGLFILLGYRGGGNRGLEEILQRVARHKCYVFQLPIPLLAGTRVICPTRAWIAPNLFGKLKVRKSESVLGSGRIHLSSG